MQLLDQAFVGLVADIRTREMATSTNDQSSTDLTVEHGSLRAGFQILEGGSKFFVMERTRASVFGSTRTNNILSFSWPAGKLTLYDDHLELKCLPGSHQVSFYNVDAIDKAWYIPFLVAGQAEDLKCRVGAHFRMGAGKKTERYCAAK